MTRFTKLLRKVWKSRSGATAIEYGLIIALIGIGIIGAARAVGVSVGNTMNSVDETLTTSLADS